ncbi:MAG: hypothetical protein IRY83_12385 [Chloroflexi bacterium]|nr:hypothetical protein [Chloroflexota bacterium]
MIGALLLRFLAFWYDFLIGDAAEIAVGIVLLLAAAGFVIRSGIVPALDAGVALAVLVVALLAASVAREGRRRMRG